MGNMNDVAKPMPRDEVFEALDSERVYQVKRWGYRQPDGTIIEVSKGVSDFLVYMHSYLDEAIDKQARTPNDDETLEVLRKVVTLGIACFEQHGVKKRSSGSVINARDNRPA